MVFFKIKLNACILIHPINHYKFLRESLRNTLFYLYCIFFSYAPSNQFFLTLPQFFFSRSPTVVNFFLKPHFASYTPFFFGSVSNIFFHEGHFSSYNHEL